MTDDTGAKAEGQADKERKRKPMAAYRFGSLEGTLRRPGVIGLMSTIG